MRPLSHEGPNICRVARSALDRALEIMGTSKGNVQLIRWDNGATLHIIAQQGFDDEFLAVFREVTIQHPSVCGRALALRRTVVVPDVMADPDFWPYRDVAVRAGFRAVQSTPMLSSGGSLVGVISTHAERIHRPSDEQFSAIASLARATADSIIAVRTHGHATEHHYSVHRAEAEWRKAHGVEQGLSPQGPVADAH